MIKNIGQNRQKWPPPKPKIGVCIHKTQLLSGITFTASLKIKPVIQIYANVSDLPHPYLPFIDKHLSRSFFLSLSALFCVMVAGELSRTWLEELLLLWVLLLVGRNSPRNALSSAALYQIILVFPYDSINKTFNRTLILTYLPWYKQEHNPLLFD